MRIHTQILYLFLYLLSYGTRSAVNPSCKWHTLEPTAMPVQQMGVHSDIVQPIGMCAYTTFYNGYTKFYCNSETELGWAIYSDSACSQIAWSPDGFLNDTQRFDCSNSLPNCVDDPTTNYAGYRYYYDEYNCSNYYDTFFITDLCLKTGTGAWYIAKVFNDSVVAPRQYDAEYIPYHDVDCSAEANCQILSDSFASYCPAQKNPILSFTGTPATLHCIPTPPCNGVDYSIYGCAHYCNTPLNMCDTGRAGGGCMDAIYKCSDDHSAVFAYWLDSGDGSCSGGIINQFFITNNSNEFDCSGPICENVLKFRRYDIPTCGDKNCSTDGCDLKDATYFVYNYIGASCPAGWTDSGYCDQAGNGVYPPDAQLHGQYFETVGCKWNSTLNGTRGNCILPPTSAPTVHTVPPTSVPSTSPTTPRPTTSPTFITYTPTTSPTITTSIPTSAPTTSAPTTSAPSTSPTSLVSLTPSLTPSLTSSLTPTTKVSDPGCATINSIKMIFYVFILYFVFV